MRTVSFSLVLLLRSDRYPQLLSMRIQHPANYNEEVGKSKFRKPVHFQYLVLKLAAYKVLQRIKSFHAVCILVHPLTRL